MYMLGYAKCIRDARGASDFQSIVQDARILNEYKERCGESLTILSDLSDECRRRIDHNEI